MLLSPDTIIALIATIASGALLWTKQAIYVLPIVIVLLVIITIMTITLYSSTIMSNLITCGVLVWYWILMFFNKDTLDAMPSNWNTYNTIISYVTMVHCFMFFLGSGFRMFTWVTMATLIAMITMQHIISTHFKTNG